MYKTLFTLAVLCCFFASLSAQTEEELKKMKTDKESQLAELESQVNAIKGEIAGIDQQLLVFPRWETGAFGIIGANLKWV